MNSHQLARGLACFTHTAPLCTPMTLPHEQDDLEDCVPHSQGTNASTQGSLLLYKEASEASSLPFLFAHTIDMAHILRRTCLVLPFLALSLAVPTSRSTLPLCGDIPQPCSCPAGATFENTTTYATIGAKASDIGHVTNDCMVHQYQYSTPC